MALLQGICRRHKKNDSMDEKQRSQPAVSGNEASGAEDSMEEAEQDQEETLIEKQKSPSLEKMKTKRTAISNEYDRET